MHTKKILALFIEDWKTITTIGRKSKVSEKNIELLQENYLEILFFTLTKGSGMPNTKKIELIKKLLNRIESDEEF